MAERLERLVRMYIKYRAAGMLMQETRTLERIREVGGTGAVAAALDAANGDRDRWPEGAGERSKHGDPLWEAAKQ